MFDARGEFSKGESDHNGPDSDDELSTLDDGLTSIPNSQART